MSNCLLGFGVSNIYCLIRTVWVCTLNSQQVDINLYSQALFMTQIYFDSLKQTILTSHDPKQYFGWFSSPKKVFLDSWMSHLTVYLTHPNKLLDTSWPWALSFLTSLVPKQHFWWFSSPKKNLPGVKNESFQRSFKSHVQEFSKRY